MQEPCLILRGLSKVEWWTTFTIGVVLKSINNSGLAGGSVRIGFILVLLALSSSVLEAQDGVMIYASPSITNQYRSDHFAQDIITSRLAMSYGVEYAHEIVENRLWFKFGVEWLDSGYQIDVDQLSFGDQIDPRRGFEFQTGPGSVKAIRRNYYQASAPLMAEYSLKQWGNWNLRAGAGASLEYFLFERSVVVYEDESGNRIKNTDSRSLDQAREVTTSLRAELGCSRQISERLTVLLSAHGRQGLGSLVQSEFATLRTRNLGLKTGLSYTL